MKKKIITGYAGYEKRPSDEALLIPAIESHEEQRGRIPHPVSQQFPVVVPVTLPKRVPHLAVAGHARFQILVVASIVKLIS
jgi:hypothetical protein